MYRWLVGDKDSFDLVQSVSDQSVKGSEAGKGGHGRAYRTRGEEDRSRKGKEPGCILYPGPPVQGTQERKFIKTEAER
jgi:hypothetical protein